MKIGRLSFAELIALTLCCFVIGSISAVSLQGQRSQARGKQCANNLRQLGLAMHNYHSAYRQLPMASGGTDVGSEREPTRGNGNRLSPFVGLTPFFEQQRVWEQIANPMRLGDVNFPPMGPVPWYPADEYLPWKMRSETLVCPDDPDAKKYELATSYVINYGDGVVSVGAPMDVELPPYVLDRASKRGAFVRQRTMRFRDFLDGLSNTLLLSEAKLGGDKVAKGVSGLGQNPSLVLKAANDPNQAFWPGGRDSRWVDGSLRSIGFQTILPPNSPSATSDVGELEGVMSASSHHGGGVHVLFGDGAVQFASDSIDVGDLTAPSVAEQSGHGRPGSRSPYGLWGALGTRASREMFESMKPGIDVPPVTLSEEEKQQLNSLPLETWTTVDGGKLRGRLILIENESNAVILRESSDRPEKFALSRFTSEDAYRVVERHLAMERKRNGRILTYLETLVGHLEKREFPEFMKLAFQSSTSAQAKEVERSLSTIRGQYISKIDYVIAGLRDGSATVQRYPARSMIEIRARKMSMSLWLDGERFFFDPSPSD